MIKKLLCCTIATISLLSVSIVPSHATIIGGIQSTVCGSEDFEPLGIGETFAVPHQLEITLNSVHDITEDYIEDNDMEYYSDVIDKVVLINYSYTNLSKRGNKFLQLKPVFYNATCLSGDDTEYMPDQLFQYNIGESHKNDLPKFTRSDKYAYYNDTVDWSVAYVIYRKSNGQKHDTLNLNLSNIGEGCFNAIFSIPMSEIK